MFKYTAPWQVLCLSLDQHKRLSAGRRDDLSSVHLSSWLQSPPPLLSDLLSARGAVMDSSPRRWVLRPLSPSLQPSDLRSISVQREHTVFSSDSISVVGGHSAVFVDAHSELSADVVVAARQVSVSQDDASSSSSSEEDLPLSPCSSSSGASHSGFYSFVEDPFSPEAEQNEAWSTSSQRQTQLATLREQNSYKLQSYGGHRRPESLFRDESAQESQYKINATHGYTVVGEQEERQLRKEIIRDQAPKKGPWIAMKDGGSPTGDNASELIEGLSISYSHVSAKPRVTFAPEAVDEEQIDFDAARKQFLQMESNNLDPIIRPRKIQVRTSPKPDATPLDREASWEEQVPTKPKMEDVFDAEFQEDQSSSSLQSSVFEESDGSLNLALTASSYDGLASDRILPEMDTNRMPPEPETPIEREIRIAQEREESFRRSRGLQHSVSGEMVTIETRRLQSPLPLTPFRAKEKGRVSFMFQEIQRKEEATKQDGASQDVGGPRRERAGSFDILEANRVENDATKYNEEYAISRVFETLQENVEGKFDVVDYALQKQNSQGGIYQDNRQSSTQLLQGYVEPYLRNARQDEMEENRDLNNQERARKLEFEGHISLEGQWKSNQNRDAIENGFTSSMEKSSPSTHPEDSADAKRDNPSQSDLRVPSWRNHLERTGLQTRGQGAADFIEKDIEDALRREQELREQREAREKLVYSPQTLVQQADKMAATQFYPQVRTDKFQSRSSSSPRPFMRLSGVPLMSPQPWSPAPHTAPNHPRTQTWSPAQTTPQTTPLISQTWSPLSTTPQTPQALPQTPQTPQSTPQTPQTPRTPLPVRGLTHTLLQDFEERRVKLKLEESAYAGIQPVDTVNNEVVESTRVTRHKNQRALQWEAGFFANLQN